MSNQGLQEDNILVMFPASKHFLKEEMITDIPSFLDERFDNDDIVIDDEEVFGSLEAFMNRQRNNNVMAPDDILAQRINRQLDAINHAQAKIKFYLEEIDIFLPRRK